MSTLTIDLEPEIERRLAEQAKGGGQTLEAYLQSPIEHLVQNGNDAAIREPEEDDEELAERTWRGVFVPQRQRRALFSQMRIMISGELPAERDIRQGRRRM